MCHVNWLSFEQQTALSALPERWQRRFQALTDPISYAGPRGLWMAKITDAYEQVMLEAGKSAERTAEIAALRKTQAVAAARARVVAAERDPGYDRLVALLGEANR